MKGTSFSATLPMRFTPPSRTISRSRAIIPPKIHRKVGSAVSPIRLKLVSTEPTATVMVLIWVVLPMPKQASAPSRA